MSLIRTISILLPAFLLSAPLFVAAEIIPGEDVEEDGEAIFLEKLPLAEDLQKETLRAACNGQPLVLMFGSSTCPYCKIVRSLYLAPLQDDGRYPGIVVRELETDSSAGVRDFSGKMTTMGQLADSYRVTLVPVVMVFTPGGHVGKTLHGLSTEDFYGAYLNQAIQSGIEEVSTMTSDAPSGVPGAYACD